MMYFKSIATKISVVMVMVGVILITGCSPSVDKPVDKKEVSSAVAKEDIKVIKQSKLSFDDTVLKVEEFIKSKNITIFYTADHGKNAKDSSLELGDSKVIVFGDPKVGTLLMQDNPQISLELPLKIAIFKDGDKVFVEYVKPSSWKDSYKLSEKSVGILGKMDGLYEAILKTVE